MPRDYYGKGGMSVGYAVVVAVQPAGHARQGLVLDVALHCTTMDGDERTCRGDLSQEFPNMPMCCRIDIVDQVII